jgi:hypothetical protein
LAGPSEAVECCGSRVAFGNATAPTGAFHRLVAGPAFYLARGVPLTADLSPPNRILDLRLAAANNDSLTVELTWTAPGGDFDFGKGEGDAALIRNLVLPTFFYNQLYSKFSAVQNIRA